VTRRHATGAPPVLAYTAAVPPLPITRRDAALHLGLFAAACATTCWYGGVAFGATLMGILTCHELGHYVVGRRRGVDVSLPYFIPLPPQISYGTMGAVIRMRDTIADRGALFDVGAAGPIAGLVVAIPLLVVGLTLSPVGPPTPGGMIEGNSALYALLKLAVFHRWLPGGGVDVNLHPMAEAAWVGLLVTMINLMPIGQLDGGHVARALLGNRHERLSAHLHLALPAIGAVVGAVMFVMALDAGRDLVGALRYASYGVIPWLTWTILLGLLRRSAGEYHPAVDDAPLDPGRRVRAILVAIVYLLIFTPVPFRPPL
jgi:membrane-associated protease RseP (regulator of RpoE activity)